MIRIVRAALTMLLVLALSVAAQAIVVDPKSEPDALLDMLAIPLDKAGIDVRRAPPEGPFNPLLLRPQLTRLSSLSPKENVERGRFAEQFSAGASPDTFLLAARGKAPVNLPPREGFKALWDTAPEADRVFVSFASKNIDAAESVASALEQVGLTPFIYKKSSPGFQQFSSVEVGEYFKSAGHHLVIDTSDARNSKGVMIEALGLAALGRSGGNPRPPFGGSSADTQRFLDELSRGLREQRSKGLPLTPFAPASNNCCELCRYVNGVLVGCTDMGCGPQCLGAKDRFGRRPAIE